ncbi:DUF4199 domain-containing protein [bacterium]|nr:DUF4199 domain-containing protein [bacterium]
MKNIKIIGIALSISIVFEIIFYFTLPQLDLQTSLYSFLFHSAILIASIFTAINFKNSSFSRIGNFKKGLVISIFYSIFISLYYFSYHNWLNPDLLENKKLLLIELSEKSETLLDAEKKISINPDYYNGKSAEDLVEMQQDNINNLLKPGKVFPMSLFSFLFIGMLFTIIISLLKYLFRKKLNDF